MAPHQLSHRTVWQLGGELPMTAFPALLTLNATAHWCSHSSASRRIQVMTLPVVKVEPCGLTTRRPQAEQEGANDHVVGPHVEDGLTMAEFTPKTRAERQDSHWNAYRQELN